MNDKNTWKIPYRTVSGREFDLWDIQPGDICVWDLAHGCAREGRFGNQIEKFYSVAEHQIHVASLCSDLLRPWALVHDAAEGLGLRDMPGPIKHWDGMLGYCVLEARVQKAIYAAFGWVGDDHASYIKLADKTMYHVENRELRGRPYRGKQTLPDIELHCWSPEEARTQYIKALASAHRELGIDLPPVFDARSREVLGP